MRIRNLLIAIAVLAVAVPSFASAAEPTGYKVTGGGQIIADSQGGGAGDTVGFVAQELEGDNPQSEAPEDLARGQFQYIPRGENTSKYAPTEKFHGVVTCLLSGTEGMRNETNEEDTYEEGIEAGMARFGGYVRGTGTGPDNPAQYFTVDVTDNGEGSDAEDDLLLVRLTTEPCGDNPENEQEDNPESSNKLGRGNVKIHNNPDEEEAASATAQALAIRSMF